MTKVYKPIFAQTIKTEQVSYTNTDTAATNKTLITAGAEGTVVNDIAVTSTDTVDVDFQVFITPSGGTASLIGTLTITAGAGNTGAVGAINLLNSTSLPFLQADGSLALEASAVLSVTNVTQVASTKQVDFTAFCGDY